ncbi:TetR/AcrR family transcriptional regulator [Microtetraspora malaysiensis]|uniref:TetR/AcrR family transcriptional regulator n=1 Tax=Microtetraspora malaysiensis TaxID=161358 RepID=UPI003D8E904D
MRSVDLTARARIRNAAIDLFGREGVNRVSVRAIAAQAGVSSALVLHHFGSKEGLRKACDAYLVETLRGGSAVDLGDTAQLGAMLDTPELRRYLARAFLDGSTEASMFFDEIVEVTERWLGRGVDEGWVRATEDPHTRAAVYITWLLAPLLLHEHVSRALGVTDLAETDAALRFSRSAIDIFTNGVFADERVLSAWDKVGKDRS